MTIIQGDGKHNFVDTGYGDAQCSKCGAINFSSCGQDPCRGIRAGQTRLCWLAEKYGCDKTKSIFHDYTPFYNELLGGRHIKRVLEIGIGTVACMNHMKEYKPGASLRMWAEYFPIAAVWGVDIDPSVMLNEGHIFSVQCDQSSEASLLAMAVVLGGRFDLIIDDGSHILEHQALTANTLIPRLLSPTGVYVIEDVIYRRELYQQLPFPVEVKIFDLKRTPDDCLFIIEGAKL